MNSVTRSVLVVLVVLVLFSLSSPAEAQQSATDRLKALAGTWDVAYEMAPGPGGGGGSGKGTLTSRLGPGGNSLILDYTSTTGPTNGLRVHQIIAWNADERVYDVVWVDSFRPGVIAARGQPEAGGIAYSRESMRGDLKVVSKGKISDIEASSFTVTRFLSLAGGPDVKTMTLRYTRQ